MVNATPADLKELESFQNVPEKELQWLIDNGYEIQLKNGDHIFYEGKPALEFYVVLEGELKIEREIKGKPATVGTTPAGIMGGELALLNNTLSMVTVQAIMPTRLLILDRDAFRLIFAHCPTFGTRVFQIASERTQGYARMVNQQERMAALGKLSAGLAHELNNPAAAASRNAQGLRDLLPELQRRTLALNGLGLTDDQIRRLIDFQETAVIKQTAAAPLSPIEQADREDELGDWLDEQEIEEAWDIAPTFVIAGLTIEHLEILAEKIPEQILEPVVRWLHISLHAAELLDEISDSSGRISELVKAVKEYTYMDRGSDKQPVDLNHALDMTLKVLKHKFKDVTLIRQLDPELPIIQGRGGELNQVWTNLIDNAVDAVDGAGEVRVITRCENDVAMVEIADSGSGIPDDVLPHIFEPFYTTKDVGKGTGLGLDITYRIVQQHNGTIDVQTKPGETRFIVRLPA